MTDKYKKTLPWLDDAPDADAAVSRLVEDWLQRRTAKCKIKASEKEKKKLAADFKAAEQGRSKASQFAIKLGRVAGIPDVSLRYNDAPMKSWERALRKKFSDSRDSNDLGRSALYILDINEYRSIKNEIHGKKQKNGELAGIPVRGVNIIEKSIKDYISTPRSSGYAGAIILDLKISFSQGRQGTHELQIRPEQYKETEKHSHYLFEMIRVVQDVAPAYRREEDKEVLKSLVIANTCFFIEAAHRYDYVQLLPRNYQNFEIKYAESKNDETETIGHEGFNCAYDMLDRVRTALERAPGKRYNWHNEAAEALSMAKTSIRNIQKSYNRIHPASQTQITPP